MTKILTQVELDEIRKRAEAATSGHWCVSNTDYPYDKPSKLVTNKHVYIAKVFVGDSDADFIAHAREDIPKLLVEIERLRELHKSPIHVLYELTGSYSTEILGVFNDDKVAEKFMNMRLSPGNCGISTQIVDEFVEACE